MSKETNLLILKELLENQSTFDKKQDNMACMIAEIRMNVKENSRTLFGNELTKQSGLVDRLSKIESDVSEFKINKREIKFFAKVSVPILKYVGCFIFFILGLIQSFMIYNYNHFMQ